MGKKEPEILNPGELEVLQQDIKTRIRFLIADTEILLNNGGQLPTVVALYIHAVEEYGKLIYTQSLKSEVGVFIIDMELFTKHNFKIELARKNLPEECFVIKEGRYDKAVYGKATYDGHEIPDWKTRLTIFNTDLKDGRVIQLPSVDIVDLSLAIKKFKSAVKIDS